MSQAVLRLPKELISSSRLREAGTATVPILQLRKLKRNPLPKVTQQVSVPKARTAWGPTGSRPCGFPVSGPDLEWHKDAMRTPARFCLVFTVRTILPRQRLAHSRPESPQGRGAG